jgi:hypothetical protein
MSNLDTQDQREVFKSESGSHEEFCPGGSRRSAAGVGPSNTKRVEDNGVPDCQLVRIDDNLTGIVDNGIHRQTPALVVDDPLAVLTGRLHVVPVAVMGN